MEKKLKMNYFKKDYCPICNQKLSGVARDMFSTRVCNNGHRWRYNANQVFLTMEHFKDPVIIGEIENNVICCPYCKSDIEKQFKKNPPFFKCKEDHYFELKFKP